MQLVGPSSLILTQAEKAVALYDPRSISGLALWLDANSLNDVLNNSDPVGSWTDKSSYSHVASQSNASYKPVFYKNKWNGNSIVRAISANSHYMTIPRHACWESNNITIICALIGFGGVTASKLLVRPHAAGAWATPYASWGVGVSYSTFERPEFLITTGASLKDAYVDSVIKYDLYNSHVIASFKYDGTANFVCKVNGVARTLTYSAGAALTGNISYTNQTNLALFARSGYSLGEYANVSLGDILVYDSALSDANLGVVVNYLKLKYGVYII